MDRVTESQLLDFCAGQQRRFDASAWPAAAGSAKDRFAVAAMLLASAPWYGHREALLDVARRLDPRAYRDAPGLLRALDFDCARFVQMLETQVHHAAGS